MNTCIHMFVCEYASSFLLGVQLGVECWGHMVTRVNILRTCYTAFKNNYLSVSLCWVLVATRAIFRLHGILAVARPQVSAVPYHGIKSVCVKHSLLRVTHNMYTSGLTDSLKEFCNFYPENFQSIDP